MKVIERGHVYKLANHKEGHQTLRFFKNLPENEPGHDGVLCQEVLRALIDRVFELNRQQPCHENIDILNNLRATLILFEKRAAGNTLEKAYRITGQNVEEQPVLGNGHIFDLVGSVHSLDRVIDLSSGNSNADSSDRRGRTRPARRTRTKRRPAPRKP